jgi:hypothetical protein
MLDHNFLVVIQNIFSENESLMGTSSKEIESYPPQYICINNEKVMDKILKKSNKIISKILDYEVFFYKNVYYNMTI